MSKYNSEYQKTWYEENKVRHKENASRNRVIQRARNKAYINNAKSKPCTDCKIQYPVYVMQFDHVRDKKEFNLATGSTRGFSIEKLQAEIDKCDVVCANCHAERTHSRRAG